MMDAYRVGSGVDDQRSADTSMRGDGGGRANQPRQVVEERSGVSDTDGSIRYTACHCESAPAVFPKNNLFDG